MSVSSLGARGAAADKTHMMKKSVSVHGQTHPCGCIFRQDQQLVCVTVMVGQSVGCTHTDCVCVRVLGVMGACCSDPDTLTAASVSV